MDPIDRLNRIDLNLLVSLYVLLEERNVTRAAQRLFITQSAASRTLTRLRELFEDPLLSRSGSKMVMTPRAQQIRDRLPGLLELVGDLVAPVEFRPATHEQTFHIALPEVFGQALIKQLLPQLLREAPGINLNFRDPDDSAQQGLLKGEIDFLIHRAGRVLAAQLHSVTLLETGGSVVARPDHPLTRVKNTSMQQLLDYPWIDCYPTDAIAPLGPLDLLLSERELQRSVVFRSTHLLSALQALADSDCLLYLAQAMGDNNILSSHCVTLDIPEAMQTEVIQLELLQHQRTLSSEPHLWLQQKLVRLFRTTNK